MKESPYGTCVSVHVEDCVAWAKDKDGHDMIGMHMPWLVKELIEGNTLSKGQRKVIALLLQKAYPKETDGTALD